MKELMHKFAYNELGEIVRAKDITTEDRLKHTYYIEGRDKNTNQLITEKVTVVIGNKKRNHFRRYPEGANRNNNFVYNDREWKETLVHKLAKKIITDRKIKRLIIPACIYRDSQSKTQIIAEKDIIFIIDDSKEESTESKVNLRYDMLVTSDTNRELALEFYVKHKVNKAKADKVKSIQREMIEIDLSDIVDKDEDIIEQLIITRLSSGDDSKIHWINNINYNKLEDYFNNQVTCILNRTNFNRNIDGEWFTWIGDYIKINKIKVCPFIYKINPDSRVARNRFLVEKECTSCKRCSLIYWDGDKGFMRCNQSETLDKDILNLIISNR